MKSGPIGKVRCAIYTRVSTDQGLDQDFNSLDAQYEASSAYITYVPLPFLEQTPVKNNREW